MLKMSAEINQEDIKNLLQTYSGDLVRKSIRSALDKTGTWAKNYIAKDVSDNFNVANSKVKKATTVTRTTQTKMEVSVNIKGPRLSIIDDFGAIQDSAGIVANVSRTHPFRVAHAFINKARSSGKRVVMKRTGRSRYPTTGKPGRGPSIPVLVNRLANRDKRDADMTSHLYQELEDQIAKRTMGLPVAAGIE